MAKYKNISKLKILLNANQKLIEILPNEVVELPFTPASCSNLLVEVLDKPLEKDESLDPLDDCVVIVSDAIVEELEKEKETSKKSKIRKN